MRPIYKPDLGVRDEQICGLPLAMRDEIASSLDPPRDESDLSSEMFKGDASPARRSNRSSGYSSAPQRDESQCRPLGSRALAVGLKAWPHSEVAVFGRPSGRDASARTLARRMANNTGLTTELSFQRKLYSGLGSRTYSLVHPGASRGFPRIVQVMGK